MAARRSPISTTSAPAAPAAPARIAARIVRGILVARVVVGDDDQIGQLGGDRAHRRALARVAVTAGAEHHREPVRSAPAQGLQHRPQRARLVRVVDQRQEVLTALDRLQPAGHPRVAQPRCGLFRGDADRVQNRQCHKAIGDVVATRQADADPVVHAGRIDGGELLCAVRAGRVTSVDAPVGGLARRR